MQPAQDAVLPDLLRPGFELRTAPRINFGQDFCEYPRNRRMPAGIRAGIVERRAGSIAGFSTNGRGRFHRFFSLATKKLTSSLICAKKGASPSVSAWVSGPKGGPKNIENADWPRQWRVRNRRRCEWIAIEATAAAQPSPRANSPGAGPRAPSRSRWNRAVGSSIRSQPAQEPDRSNSLTTRQQ